MNCTVYRCARQQEMYLYVREGLSAEHLPPALLTRTGALSRVMDLALTPQRRLARADVLRVIERLDAEGFYLQMPPNGQVEAHMYFGD